MNSEQKIQKVENLKKEGLKVFLLVFTAPKNIQQAYTSPDKQASSGGLLFTVH